MWRLGDLRRKEVVNIRDGTRLGFVTDVEIDEVDGRIESLVVPGPTRLFGLFGREEDYIISWDEIETLGEDIVLVSVAMPDRRAQGARERRVRRRHFPIEAFLQGGFRWSCCRKRNLRKMEGKGACAGEGCAPSACFPKFTSQVFFPKNFSFEERCGMIRGRIL